MRPGVARTAAVPRRPAATRSPGHHDRAHVGGRPARRGHRCAGRHRPAVGEPARPAAGALGDGDRRAPRRTRPGQDDARDLGAHPRTGRGQPVLRHRAGPHPQRGRGHRRRGAGDRARRHPAPSLPAARSHDRRAGGRRDDRSRRRHPAGRPRRRPRRRRVPRPPRTGGDAPPARRVLEPGCAAVQPRARARGVDRRPHTVAPRPPAPAGRRRHRAVRRRARRPRGPCRAPLAGGGARRRSAGRRCAGAGGRRRHQPGRLRRGRGPPHPCRRNCAAAAEFVTGVAAGRADDAAAAARGDAGDALLRRHRPRRCSTAPRSWRPSSATTTCTAS